MEETHPAHWFACIPSDDLYDDMGFEADTSAMGLFFKCFPAFVSMFYLLPDFFSSVKGAWSQVLICALKQTLYCCMVLLVLA